MPRFSLKSLLLSVAIIAFLFALIFHALPRRSFQGEWWTHRANSDGSYSYGGWENGRFGWIFSGWPPLKPDDVDYRYLDNVVVYDYVVFNEAVCVKKNGAWVAEKSNGNYEVSIFTSHEPTWTIWSHALFEEYKKQKGEF